MNKRVLVVGAGGMAEAYHSVLSNMGVEFDVVCRSTKSAERFHKETGCFPRIGGVKDLLSAGHLYSHAIVATGVEHLFDVASVLLVQGVKNILIEKPGALYFSQLEAMNKLSKEQSALVYVAYNRRHYASVQRLLGLVDDDGGITSMHFDFTEWADRISPLEKGEGVKERWVLSNSTHVIDLAFFLSGVPTTLNSIVRGSLSWHLAGSRFVGCGITEKDVTFSYRSDWESQGRWGITVYTNKHSYSLCPLEGLSRTARNSVVPENILLDEEIDRAFKPGLYRQVESFIGDEHLDMCPLEDHVRMFPIFEEIAGYN